MSTSSRPRLLLISYRFPPEPYPLAIGLRGVIDGLRKHWSIDVITAAENAYAPPNVTVHHVPPRSLDYRWLHRLKLGWLANLGTWPDPFLPLGAASSGRSAAPGSDDAARRHSDVYDAVLDGVCRCARPTSLWRPACLQPRRFADLPRPESDLCLSAPLRRHAMDGGPLRPPGRRRRVRL